MFATDNHASRFRSDTRCPEVQFIRDLNKTFKSRAFLRWQIGHDIKTTPRIVLHVHRVNEFFVSHGITAAHMATVVTGARPVTIRMPPNRSPLTLMWSPTASMSHASSK